MMDGGCLRWAMILAVDVGRTVEIADFALRVQIAKSWTKTVGLYLVQGIDRLDRSKLIA